MKKTTPKDKPSGSNVEAEPMPEVDFSKGVRGKHYQRLREEGFTVRIDPSPARDDRPSKSARVSRAR